MRTTRTLVALTGALAVLACPSVAAAQTPPPDSSFQKVVIDDSPGEPMDLAVMPDGRVLHVTRQGQVWLHDPDTGLKTLAAELDVYQHDEEGLQNIALDPNFEQNGWVYMYYSPPLNTPVDNPATPTVNEGDAPEFGTAADWERFKGVIRLSRFQWDEATDTIDLDSEEQIIDVPVDRGICCHVGGDIVFDGEGNLYLSTGDDTNPFQSGGYTPIDERAGRNPAFDAQRTSANTNDLRGKVLRITPTEGGGYTIPEGNLFEDNDPLTRPEIYLMGLRNPFRIEYNREEGELYVADYSPDAQVADPLARAGRPGQVVHRDRAGQLRLALLRHRPAAVPRLQLRHQHVGRAVQLRQPGQHVAEQHRPHHSCRRSHSRRSGTRTASRRSSRSSRRAGSARWRVRPTSSTARRPRAATPPRGRQYYDNVPLFYEWTRDYIKEFRLNASRTQVADINSVLDSFALVHPIDIEFGPDGSLYVLNYGQGFFGQNQPGAELVRIDYLGNTKGNSGKAGNFAPTVSIQSTAAFGLTPLTVRFTSTVSDPEGAAAPLRVGLRRGRPGRLARGEPDVHLHRERRVQRDAQGDRPGRALGHRLRDGSSSATPRRPSTSPSRCSQATRRSTSATRSTTRSRSPTTCPSTARACR